MSSNLIGTAHLSSYSQHENQNGSLQINRFPLHITIKILEQLSNEDNKALASTNRLWNREVKKFSKHNLKIFGKDEWRKYYNFEADHFDPPSLGWIEKKMDHISRRIKGDKLTFYLIHMPKGLTMNQIIKIMQHPKNNHNITVNLVNKDIIDALGNLPIKKSYWFIFSNDLIENMESIKDSYCHLAHCKEIFEFIFQEPTALEAMVCCLMHKVCTGVYLPEKKQCNLFRTQTKIQDYASVIISGVYNGMLMVDYEEDCDPAICGTVLYKRID